MAENTDVGAEAPDAATKIPRRRKPVEEHRSRYVQVRISQNEYDLINGWANQFGVNISRWVRTRLLRAVKNGAKSL